MASKRHHYVPRCWLLGFTDDGKPDGPLYVTDLKRRNQFRSSPPNVGYRKFFNRIEGDPDPDSGEKLYQVIEDATAPLLRELYDEPRYPTESEIEALVRFAVVQTVRTPTFRKTIDRIDYNEFQKALLAALSSEVAWKAATKAYFPDNEEEDTFEEAVRFKDEIVETGQYLLNSDNEHYLKVGFQVADHVGFPAFRRRHWTAMLSTSGSFIGIGVRDRCPTLLPRSRDETAVRY